MSFDIQFEPSGRGKARCPSNPEFPTGKDIDVSAGQFATCLVTLPYPSPECGIQIVRCNTCQFSAALTVAGRPDDPKTVKLPCKGE
jgi:hypothetical protein